MAPQVCQQGCFGITFWWDVVIDAVSAGLAKGLLWFEVRRHVNVLKEVALCFAAISPRKQNGYCRGVLQAWVDCL